jgi:hypothetical protein
MKFLLIVSFTIYSLSGSGQTIPGIDVTSDSENERIFVQLNSTLLLTGETLYFQVFCRQAKDNRPTRLSKVAYVELIGENGTPAFQAKVALEKGSGHGDFFVPSNFSSGNYTLVAYTRWMKNFTTESFYRNQVTIVNPFMRLTEVARGSGKVVAREKTAGSTNRSNFELKLSGHSFKPREKVSLTFAGSTAATVCVSVRKKEASLDDAGSIVIGGMAETGGVESPTPIKGRFIPEMRGHLITGSIASTADQPSGKVVLASLPGQDFVLRATKTDPSGNFVMVVDSIPPSSTILFQVVDNDIRTQALKIDNPFLDDYSKFRPGPLAIDASLWKIVDERSVFTQIENAYYQGEKDVVVPKTPGSFYNTPDKVYRLDDFTRFPTMEDVFREYVPEVITKKSKANFSLHIVKIDDLPPIRSHREKLVGIQSGRLYSFPDYSKDKLKLERVPDYRLQLYWGPSVFVSKDQVKAIEFFTSDVQGDFELVVEGISVTGEIFSEREVFSVVK